MKREKRTIRPDEVGTTYKLLEGYQGAHNRNINAAHVKYLSKNMDTVRWLSEIVLLKEGDTYHVMDGSHTLLAAKKNEKPVEFMKVTIMEDKDIKKMGKPLPTILHWLNRGKKYRKGDHLYTLQSEAKPWFDLAKEFDIPIGKVDSRRKFTWSGILQAKRWADKCHASGKFMRYVVNEVSFEAEKELWVTSTEETLRPLFEALFLWDYYVAQPAAEEGFFSPRSKVSLMIAYLIKLQNPKGNLDKFFIRCGKYLKKKPFADTLRERDFRKALREVLKAGNHRVKIPFVAVGENGRD